MPAKLDGFEARISRQLGNLGRPDKAALADLIGTVLTSLRITRGKVSSAPTRERPRGGGLLANTEFNGIGGSASLHRNWCRSPPSRHF
jgi:hypothetical protein